MNKLADHLPEGFIPFREVPEPYIFKYVAQFMYNKEKHTLFADSIEKLNQLIAHIVPDSEGVILDSMNFLPLCAVQCKDWELPIMLLEVEKYSY